MKNVINYAPYEEKKLLKITLIFHFLPKSLGSKVYHNSDKLYLLALPQQ